MTTTTTTTTKRKGADGCNRDSLTSNHPVKEADMDNTTAIVPVRNLDETVEIPCHRKGCDAEGQHHTEYKSMWEDDHVLCHDIAVGVDVILCAADDEPWTMYIDSREVRGTLEMENIANDVRRAVNLATDLNAPIIDQWQRVGQRWELA